MSTAYTLGVTPNQSFATPGVDVTLAISLVGGGALLGGDLTPHSANGGSFTPTSRIC